MYRFVFEIYLMQWAVWRHLTRLYVLVKRYRFRIRFQHWCYH